MSLLTLIPWIDRQWHDDNGDPVENGFVRCCVAGLSTLQDTYSDANGLHLNTNPVALDSAGRANIFLLAATYDFYILDANGVQVGFIAAVSSTGLAATTTGLPFHVFGGDPNCPITSTSYPSGATFDKLHAGTNVWEVDSGNVPGTIALQVTMLSNAGEIVSAALVNLSDGTPDTPIASVTSISTTGDQPQSSTITLAAPGSTKQYGIKTKVAATGTQTGWAWMATIIRTS